MALEYRTSVTTTIDPNGYILLRFLSEIWNEGARVKPGSIHRVTLAPGDEIPETFTIPDVGEVPAPAELSEYVSVAHTPERITRHKNRREPEGGVARPQQPRRIDARNGR